MRNDRSGKMLNYSALALGFLAANNSEAQIVYTDVEPDMKTKVCNILILILMVILILD